MAINTDTLERLLRRLDWRRVAEYLKANAGGGSGGAVTSVFTRTGDVVATTGDYTVAQITGAASSSSLSSETSRAEVAEALLAPLANPALTGIPTAPTASALTDSTQLATTAYTDTAVGVETTRAEAAEALLAPLASPALTGSPTAPTKTALTNNTDVATTAYTDAAVAAAEALALPLTGGTMSGAIAMGSHKITGLTNGSAASDVAAFGQIPVTGGRGTPDVAAVSLTASSANELAGTSIALVTGSLSAGSRFRWNIGLTKTAAGIATWAAAVKFGTANTTSDAAIATWTSGTNTALIDQAILIIDMHVLTTGGSATASCIAFYSNAYGTTATGLGSIGAAPGSTATFNSAATSPFLHVDITPGASAVMTGWGAAEQLR